MFVYEDYKENFKINKLLITYYFNISLYIYILLFLDYYTSYFFLEYNKISSHKK